MDTSYQENYNVPIKGFVGKKQTSLFNVFKIHHFSGEVNFIEPKGSQWQFYFSLGRLVCATGGEHSVRRWRRYLAIYLPSIAQDTEYLGKEIQAVAEQDIQFCWEYELLRKWVIEGKADRDSVIKMVTSITTEILFDMNQCWEISFQMDANIDIPMEEQVCLFDAKDLMISAWKQWQKWINAQLGDRSPNKCPLIRSPEDLQAILPPKTYHLFSKLFNGRNTLRDLAIKLKKDLYKLSTSLLPYIQKGYIELVSVPDLPSPVPRTSKPKKPTTIDKPLIVCVDDSPMICETMRSLITKAGYKFVGITQPFRAMTQLISLKPDIIFLDLMMPNTNGYEICAGLRKSSALKDTPIIILTANDGMLERVRSKMTGASDFMAKPINSQQVLATINKYLSLAIDN
jgi:chemotaxis family two-component system response regulator PixG